jgi:hypothetical protein
MDSTLAAQVDQVVARLLAFRDARLYKTGAEANLIADIAEDVSRHLPAFSAAVVAELQRGWR